MARQLKDKMKMPSKRRDEAEMDEELDIDMLEGEEDEMPEDMAEDEMMMAEEEGGSELEIYSDDEILEEAKMRGLIADEDMPEEEDMEMAEDEEELEV